MICRMLIALAAAPFLCGYVYGDDAVSTAPQQPIENSASAPTIRQTNDPSGTYQFTLTFCGGVTYYSDGGSFVTGQPFPCSQYLTGTGPTTRTVTIAYNAASSTATISNGLASPNTPETFVVRNKIGLSPRQVVGSQVVSPGCTVTYYVSDGIDFTTSETSYVLAYDYAYSSGCSSYLQSQASDIESGNSIVLFNALHATNGIDVTRIQSMTDAVIFFNYSPNGSASTAARSAESIVALRASYEATIKADQNSGNANQPAERQSAITEDVKAALRSLLGPA